MADTKIEAPYNIIIGQRSGGKTLIAAQQIHDTYIKTGKPSIYIRRNKPPLYVNSMEDFIKLTNKGKDPGEEDN